MASWLSFPAAPGCPLTAPPRTRFHARRSRPDQARASNRRGPGTVRTRRGCEAATVHHEPRDAPDAGRRRGRAGPRSPSSAPASPASPRPGGWSGDGADARGRRRRPRGAATRSAASSAPATSTACASTSAPSRCWPAAPRRSRSCASSGLGDDVVHPAHDGRRPSSPAARCTRCRRAPSWACPATRRRCAALLTDAEVARVGRRAARCRRRRVTDDVDVASWVGARLGPAVVDRLVEPLLGGVYAGHAARLSLRATMPQLWDAAVAGGSLLDAVSASRGRRGGRRRRATRRRSSPACAAASAACRRRSPPGLAARGVEIRTGTTVRGLRRTPAGWRLELGDAARSGGAPAGALDADGVVLAVPAAAAAPPAGRATCRRPPPSWRRSRPPASRSSPSLYRGRTPPGLTGSGLLVPPVEGRASRPPRSARPSGGGSTSWTPTASPLRARSAGPARRRSLQRADADLVALAVADLADLTGRPVRPLAAPGDPLGRRAAAVRGGPPRPGRPGARRGRPLPGLAVCGAAYDGVGIPACVAAATARPRGDLGRRAPRPAGGRRMPA